MGGPDRWLARADGAGVESLLADHLGSVRDVLDAAGGVIDATNYDPFGATVSETDAAAGGRLGFQGGELDRATGTYVFGARQFSPLTGRWDSLDPMGFAAGDPNLSRFAGNAPTDHTDPSGLFWDVDSVMRSVNGKNPDVDAYLRSRDVHFKREERSWTSLYWSYVTVSPNGDNKTAAGKSALLVRATENLSPDDVADSIIGSVAAKYRDDYKAFVDESAAKRLDSVLAGYTAAWKGFRKANAEVRGSAAALRKQGVKQYVYREGLSQGRVIRAYDPGDGRRTHEYDWNPALDYIVKRSREFDSYLDESLRVAADIQARKGLTPAQAVEELRDRGARISNTFQALAVYVDLVNLTRSVPLEKKDVIGEAGFIHGIIDYTNSAYAYLEKLRTRAVAVQPLVEQSRDYAGRYFQGLQDGDKIRKLGIVIGCVTGGAGLLRAGAAGLSFAFANSGRQLLLAGGEGLTIDLVSGAVLEVSAAGGVGVLGLPAAFAMNAQPGGDPPQEPARPDGKDGPNPQQRVPQPGDPDFMGPPAPAAGRKFLTPDEFGKLPQSGTIDPKQVRFSQDSIASHFKEGGAIEDLVAGLKAGKVDPSTIPAIRIVEKDGKIFTLDNRRLKVFQEAGIPIKYEKLDAVPKREGFKFTTKNDGIDIDIRRAKE